MNLLPRASDYADASNNNNNNNNNNNTNRQARARGRTALEAILDADSSDDEEEEEAPPPGTDWAANWIRRVNEGSDDVFRARLNSTMLDSTIRGIVDKHDGKSTGSISTLKKKLEEWSKLPSYLHRKYFFYSVLQLKERILELDGQATVTGKKDALFDLVVNTERNRVRRNTLLDNDEEPYDEEDAVDPVLLDIFKASKMKPLGEEAKKYCRAGHLLERPFLEQFHQHSLEGRTLGYKSLAIHETPVGMYYIILFLFIIHSILIYLIRDSICIIYTFYSIRLDSIRFELYRNYVLFCIVYRFDSIQFNPTFYMIYYYSHTAVFLFNIHSRININYRCS
jgi:hypothetical protein